MHAGIVPFNLRLPAVLSAYVGLSLQSFYFDMNLLEALGDGQLLEMVP